MARGKSSKVAAGGGPKKKREGRYKRAEGVEPRALSKFPTFYDCLNKQNLNDEIDSLCLCRSRSTASKQQESTLYALAYRKIAEYTEKDALDKRGLCKSLAGCNDEELIDLRERFKVPLPADFAKGTSLGTELVTIWGEMKGCGLTYGAFRVSYKVLSIHYRRRKLLTMRSPTERVPHSVEESCRRLQERTSWGHSRRYRRRRCRKLVDCSR